MSEFRRARWLPRHIAGPRTLPLLRGVARLARGRHGAHVVHLASGATVRVFRPPLRDMPRAGMVWLHAGGYVAGVASQDDLFCRRFSDELGIVVASVDYRLAPEHPFPAGLDDAYDGLRWLAGQTDVDPDRIAVAGASAGGGLAAALTLLACERGEVRPALQLLSYPMLDDRTAMRTDIDERPLRLWDQRSNRFAWCAYLGPHAASGPVPPLASPGRYEDLHGLPPAWIGVGTHDLFHDEAVTYADRLWNAGVSTTLHEVDGGYHAFDYLEPKSAAAQAFLRGRTEALVRDLQLKLES